MMNIFKWLFGRRGKPVTVRYDYRDHAAERERERDEHNAQFPEHSLRIVTDFRSKRPCYSVQEWYDPMISPGGPRFGWYTRDFFDNLDDAKRAMGEMKRVRDEYAEFRRVGQQQVGDVV
jgi:hypothetical protein